jgi:hypothetical protein
LLAQPFDGTPREVDFSEEYESNMTVSPAANSITIPATGSYEITYSGSYRCNATGFNNLYLYLYENGSDYGYNGELRSTIEQSSSVNGTYPFHKSFIGSFTSGDVLELYYERLSGSATEISFFNLNFSVKRLK